MRSLNHKIPLLYVILAVICNIIGMGSALASMDAPADPINAAIEQAIGGDTYGASQRLDELSESEVIEAIVERLQHDPRFREKKLRSFAYRVLGRKSAGRTDIGYALLISCLSEPEYRLICISSLADVPDARQLEVANRLMTLLNDPSLSEAEQTAILRNLPKYGQHSRAGLRQIEQIFDNRNLETNIRFIAFLAMLRLSTIEQALAHVRDEDARAVVSAFARHREFVPASFNTDNQHRQRIYNLVLVALRDKNPEVRLLGLESIGAIYGENMYLIRSASDFEMEPALKSALEEIARNDPEIGLRYDAERMLDREMQAKYVAKILEARQNQPSGNLP